MVVIKAIINEIVFANEDENAFSVFKEYGFNIKTDLKDCGLKDSFIEENREELLLRIRSEMALGRPQFCLEENGSEAICVIKERYPNKKHNRGARYGFRLIVFIDASDNKATIFHIYDKVKKKDLTENEKKQIKNMII